MKVILPLYNHYIRVLGKVIRLHVQTTNGKVKMRVPIDPSITIAQACGEIESRLRFQFATELGFEDPSDLRVTKLFLADNVVLCSQDIVAHALDAGETVFAEIALVQKLSSEMTPSKQDPPPVADSSISGALSSIEVRRTAVSDVSIPAASLHSTAPSSELHSGAQELTAETLIIVAERSAHANICL